MVLIFQMLRYSRQAFFLPQVQFIYITPMVTFLIWNFIFLEQSIFLTDYRHIIEYWILYCLINPILLIMKRYCGKGHSLYFLYIHTYFFWYTLVSSKKKSGNWLMATKCHVWVGFDLIVLAFVFSLRKWMPSLE